MVLWTTEHAVTLLPSVVVMIVLSVILGKFLGHREMKLRMIPFYILTVLLVALEIGKQAVSLSEGYDLYHLPFHFCSLFIFMLPVMSLYRGKYLSVIRGITAALCGSVFLLMMAYPALIYSAADIRAFFSNYLSFHTVAFHSIVVFAYFLIIALRLHNPDGKEEQKGVIWFMAGFCAVSATMAQLLKTNFNNFYSCNIGPLESVRQNMQTIIGYGWTQALYVLIVTLLDICFVLGSYWLYRGIRRLLSERSVVQS